MPRVCTEKKTMSYQTDFLAWVGDERAGAAPSPEPPTAGPGGPLQPRGGPAGDPTPDAAEPSGTAPADPAAKPATPATPAPEPDPPAVEGEPDGPILIRAELTAGELRLVCPTVEIADALEADRPALESVLADLAGAPATRPVGPDGKYPAEGIGGPDFLPRWLERQDRAAWHWSPGGRRLVGPDANGSGGEWDSLDDPRPCERCGEIATWDDLAGGRHCGVCERDKLARSLRLVDRAARLRAETGLPPRAPAADAAEGSGRCWWCGGRDFWRSALCPDVVRCRNCHPPGPRCEAVAPTVKPTATRPRGCDRAAPPDPKPAGGNRPTTANLGASGGRKNG